MSDVGEAYVAAKHVREKVYNRLLAGLEKQVEEDSEVRAANEKLYGLLRAAVAGGVTRSQLRTETRLYQSPKFGEMMEAAGLTRSGSPGRPRSDVRVVEDSKVAAVYDGSKWPEFRMTFEAEDKVLTCYHYETEASIAFRRFDRETRSGKKYVEWYEPGANTFVMRAVRDALQKQIKAAQAAFETATESRVSEGMGHGLVV